MRLGVFVVLFGAAACDETSMVDMQAPACKSFLEQIAACPCGNSRQDPDPNLAGRMPIH